MSPSVRSTITASFESPQDAEAARGELRASGFSSTQIRLRAHRWPHLIVQAGTRYTEVEHVLRGYQLRSLRLWLVRDSGAGSSVSRPLT